MADFQNAIDDLVHQYWEHGSIFGIAKVVSEELSITVSPKQVYSSHLRIKRMAQAEVDKFKR